MGKGSVWDKETKWVWAKSTGESVNEKKKCGFEFREYGSNVCVGSVYLESGL